jgi:hypothetical protein
MVMCGDLGSELVRRIDRRVNVPPELLLGRTYRVHDVVKRRVSDHQEVNVAGRAKLTPGRRSKQERDLNPIAKRCESIA